MPAIAIVLFGALFSLLALLLFYWHLLAMPPRKARTRNTRRGGYIKPPAYRGMSHGTIPPPRVTATTGSISSPSTPGDPLAGSAILARRAQPSRLTVPTAFGVVTVDHGASGQQRDSAA